MSGHDCTNAIFGLERRPTSLETNRFPEARFGSLTRAAVRAAGSVQPCSWANVVTIAAVFAGEMAIPSRAPLGCRESAAGCPSARPSSSPARPESTPWRDQKLIAEIAHAFKLWDDFFYGSLRRLAGIQPALLRAGARTERTDAPILARPWWYFEMFSAFWMVVEGVWSILCGALGCSARSELRTPCSERAALRHPALRPRRFRDQRRRPRPGRGREKAPGVLVGLVAVIHRQARLRDLFPEDLDRALLPGHGLNQPLAPGSARRASLSERNTLNTGTLVQWHSQIPTAYIENA